ncbi:hypothetical protein CJF30_00000025 [Rutstroemia sp. NJR-2017a BBW]|nr:hypothetical protein CJF30_00000025 [Rutstroemia sp. NJR-2017a BBW]
MPSFWGRFSQRLGTVNELDIPPSSSSTLLKIQADVVNMSVFSAQVHPGRALGFLVLGASLHEIITRIKAEPQRFPKLDLIYEPAAPVDEPVILNLPSNGVRLRFDGPQQRLRLIEVLDFTKNKLTYNDREVLRSGGTSSPGLSSTGNLSGPTFRHIYKSLVGPTFPGEYIEPEPGDETGMGLYVLSYPGIAFSFPIHSSSWSPGKDVVSLLSSSASQPASSMAIFSGESWPEARDHIYTQALQPLKTFAPLTKSREPVADEVSLIRLYGGGQLELVRPSTTPFWILLGETTPQELVAELGPPDAIYRKNDQKMSIHKARTASSTGRRPASTDLRDDSTDTDQSSAHTATDDSEDDSGDGEVVGNVSGECFYNYFYHGFDVLVSTPTLPSQLPPSKADSQKPTNKIIPTDATPRLVATKVIMHGNVPGSYPFNRHRRCRWEIEYLSSKPKSPIINSETAFSIIESSLHNEWKSIYSNVEEAKQRQRGMVLNRDWGDSPGSSCELLGGWEDSVGGKRSAGREDEKGLGNTTLFGFPGLVFEVLKNGTVSGVTVF